MKNGLPDTWGAWPPTGRTHLLNQGSQLQAVIFDFDLTLADSSKAAGTCIAFALDKMGFEEVSQEAVRKTIGLTLEATLESLTGNTDPLVQAQFRGLFVQQADVVMVAQTEFLEGAHAALTTLREAGLRLAIVSTKYRYRIEAILDRQEARDLFEVIVGGEDTSTHKPDPEGLLRVLRELRVGQTQAVYVGDHVVDALAAMRAGIPFVPVLTGATDREDFLELPHLKVLGSVAELPPFLAQVGVWPPPVASPPPRENGRSWTGARGSPDFSGRRGTLNSSGPPRGIVAFDLDGTLLRGDTVCELLARPLGRVDEMRRFEALTAEPDIALARAEMVEWYQGHSVDRLRAYLRDATWAPGAPEAVRRLQGADILVAIASYTWEFAVEWFAQELNVHHYLGTDVSPEGRILHVWGRDKARWLGELAAEHAVSPERTAAVGDSMGDADMLRVAGFRFFVGSSLPDGIGEVIHMPGADLRDVADRILGEWVS